MFERAEGTNDENIAMTFEYFVETEGSPQLTPVYSVVDDITRPEGLELCTETWSTRIHFYSLVTWPDLN